MEQTENQAEVGSGESGSVWQLEARVVLRGMESEIGKQIPTLDKLRGLADTC